ILLPSIQAIPVDQEKPDMVGLKKIIQIVRGGNPVILFPEGSRSYTKELLPAMPGVGLVVNKTQAPVVPVRLFGVQEIWPRDGKIKWFLPAEIVFGPALHFPPTKDYQSIGDRIMQAIGDLK